MKEGWKEGGRKEWREEVIEGWKDGGGGREGSKNGMEVGKEGEKGER